MSIPVPSGVTALADQLRTDTGGQVDTVHVQGSRWRITARNARVLMWVEYTAHSRGRLTWQRSELHVDGRQAERAESYQHLVRIFADPDGASATDDEPDDQLHEVDLAQAPVPVRDACAKLRPVMRDGMRLVVRRGQRTWRACLEGKRVQLRLNFVIRQINPSRPLAEQTVVPAPQQFGLTVDGEDRTEQIQGRLDKALAMITAHQGAPGPAAVSGPADAAVNDSVRVARTTVIRT